MTMQVQITGTESVVLIRGNNTKDILSAPKIALPVQISAPPLIEGKPFIMPTFTDSAVRAVVPGILVGDMADIPTSLKHPNFVHYGVYSNPGNRGAKSKCSSYVESDEQAIVKDLRPFPRVDSGAHLLDLTPVLIKFGSIHVVPKRHVYCIGEGNRGVLFEQPGGQSVTPQAFTESVRGQLYDAIDKHAAPAVLKRISAFISSLSR